ncbi:hypothetical protein ACFO5R_21285 [Halosolutus amylolyticus]|uniref:Uncharacterized protein n=1 Tax=Halosolutus amylolyticus TaxID=2932267 RepID=A0ABD5PVC2_9EURY|nr:hypothetical protein [Halosolutus amylolyticus]
MNELVLPLASESPLPIGIVGWGVLLLGLLVTVVWLIYLYR